MRPRPYTDKNNPRMTPPRSCESLHPATEIGRRHRRGRWAVLCAMLSCLAAGHVLAAPPADDPALPSLRLNGFGTLGYVSTHSTQPWTFQRDVAQPVSSQHGAGFLADSNLGLQASMQASERLSLVGQVVLRRRAASSTAQESLEWAFASYRLQPDLTVRIGRTSPDLFLLTDHRNVGFSYPWVRPNVEFYGWMPLYSVDGVDVAKSWQNGPVRWEVKGLFGGTNRMTVPAMGGLADAEFRGRDGYAATLSREEGGLTLKLSLAQAHGQLKMDPQVEQIFTGLRQLSTMLPVPQIAQEAAALNAALPLDGFTSRYAGAGVQWESGRWLLQAEIARVGGNLKPNTGVFGYAGVGYRIGSVTLTGMLGRARPAHGSVADPQWAATLTPLLGPALAEGAQTVGSAAAAAANVFRMEQRSVSAGMRWDMTSQLALKLQWDRVHVEANGSGLWGNGSSSPARADVYSASLNFIF